VILPDFGSILRIRCGEKKLIISYTESTTCGSKGSSTTGTSSSKQHEQPQQHLTDNDNLLDQSLAITSARTDINDDQATDVEDHPSTSRTEDLVTSTASGGDRLTDEDDAIPSRTVPQPTQSNALKSNGLLSGGPDIRVTAPTTDARPRLNRTLDLSLTKLNGTATAPRRSSRVAVLSGTAAHVDTVDRGVSSTSNGANRLGVEVVCYLEQRTHRFPILADAIKFVLFHASMNSSTVTKMTQICRTSIETFIQSKFMVKLLYLWLVAAFFIS